MLNTLQLFNSYKLSHIGVIVTLFGASTAISIVNIGFFITLVGVLIEGNYKQRILKLSNSPVTLPLILLMCWGFIGAIYSDAESNALNRQLKIFSKISLILLLILAAETEMVVKRAWTAFICGACFTLISTYLNIYFQLPWSTTQNLGWGKDHTVFYNYISQSIVFAFVIGTGLVYALIKDQKTSPDRIFWILLVFLSLISVFFLSTGRVGLVAIAVSVIYVVAGQFKLRGVLLIVFFGAICLYAIWGEYGIGARLAAGVRDLQDFQGIQNSQTSWGARLSMYLLSLKFIAQAPLFGHGLGDYQTLAMAYYELPSMKAISGYHPHNQYLYLFVELGIIGLGLFLWLHFTIWQSAQKSAIHWQKITGIFIIVLVVDSMFHAPFWMSGERNFFFPLIGLFAAHGIHSSKYSIKE